MRQQPRSRDHIVVGGKLTDLTLEALGDGWRSTRRVHANAKPGSSAVGVGEDAGALFCHLHPVDVQACLLLHPRVIGGSHMVGRAGDQRGVTKRYVGRGVADIDDGQNELAADQGQVHRCLWC